MIVLGSINYEHLLTTRSPVAILLVVYCFLFATIGQQKIGGSASSPGPLRFKGNFVNPGPTLGASAVECSLLTGHKKYGMC